MGIVITIVVLWVLCGLVGAYLYTEVFGLQYSMDLDEILLCAVCGPASLCVAIYESVKGKCPEAILMSPRCREFKRKRNEQQ